MGNNDLIQAICTLVNDINSQSALKRIYNLTFYLILHEEMGGETNEFTSEGNDKRNCNRAN